MHAAATPEEANGSSRLNYKRGGWWVEQGPSDIFALSTKASSDKKPLIADKHQQRS